MANIEFSKLGAAIVRNPVLAGYIVSRMGSLTPQEEAAGFIEVKFKKATGGPVQTLKLVFGRPYHLPQAFKSR